MNKIRRLLPYLVITFLVVISIGSVGNVANASKLSDDIFDRVADKIAERLLDDLDSESLNTEVFNQEESLGWSTKDEIWLNNDSGVIYFDTDKGSGIRVASGIMQCKNSGGSWGACSGATPGDEGWLADSANNFMYPATNAAGDFYPLVLGESATSTPADADTELYVGGGGGLVVEGIIRASSTLEVESGVTLYSTLAVVGDSALTGTLTVTGAVTNSSTLAQTGVATFSADPIIGGTTPTLTIGDAGAEDTSLVFDGTAQDFYVGLDDTDDDLKIGVGSAVGTTPSIAIAEDLAIIVYGTINGQAAVDFDTTLNVDGAMTVAAITGDGNWATTGNFSGANVTATGDFTAGGSLYVINTGDNVGIGSSTPFYRLSVVDTSAQLALSYDSAGVVTFSVDASDDLTIDATGDDILISDALSVGTSTASAYALDVYGDVRFGEAGSASAFTLNTGTQAASFGGAVTVTGAFAVTSTSIFTGSATFNGSALIGINGALDAAAGTALSIGTSTATSIEIADTLVTTNIQGPLTAAETVVVTGSLTANASVLVGVGGALDAAAGTALSIGTSTATSIEIADTAITTNIQGPLTAAETVVVTGTLAVTGVVTLTTDLVVDTNTLFVDASANAVGVGTTTPANQLEVHAATGSSTVSVIAETAGSGGRIILEDSDGAGCSEIYILDGTIISAAVTCPAN